MSKREKTRISRKNLIYTAVALLLLALVLVYMVFYMLEHTKEEAYANLKAQTVSIESDINLQMISDRENLMTMANFASSLYKEGKDFSLLFASFEEIGMLEKVRILLPDGTYMTKKGNSYVGDKISFEAEAARGEYVSGRVPDLMDPKTEVVRSAVPIRSDGKVVGILYGVISLPYLEERFGTEAKNLSADLLIVEGGNGNYIVNTVSNHLGNISNLASAEFEEGFSFEKLLTDISEGNPGFASFRSSHMPEFYYACYDDLSFSDWRILLAKPKSEVFAKATSTGMFVFVIVMAVLIITLAYVALIFGQERRKLARKQCASSLRKQLLQMRHRAEHINTALREISEFVSSRSVFFMDTLGESYIYIRPDQEDKLLGIEDRQQLVSRMMSYAAGQIAEAGADVGVYRVHINKKFQKGNPEFYSFLQRHHIKNLSFAVVNNTNTTCFLGIANAKGKDDVLLLKDVAVCFSMAVYNKKHLDKTEEMAQTDPLTGVANRMAYKNDLKRYELKMPQTLACVYIDVNELHYFNNTYGHVAGDQMLIYIADVIKKQFPESVLYRMGGDEFLTFAENIREDEMKARIQKANTFIEEMKYHISVGVSYGKADSSIESIVNEAEKKMYENKAFYYQKKSQKRIVHVDTTKVEHLTTGNHAVDAALEIASQRYFGIYCVHLARDKAEPILIPAYLKPYSERGDSFSSVYTKYVREAVKPEYHRAMLGMLQYDSLKAQLKTEYVPSVIYEKVDGDKVCLSVHAVKQQSENDADTLWTFEKMV